MGGADGGGASIDAVRRKALISQLKTPNSVIPSANRTLRNPLFLLT
jgi:hypothetical protein